MTDVSLDRRAVRGILLPAGTIFVFLRPVSLGAQAPKALPEKTKSEEKTMRKKFLAVALILALAATLCPTVLAAGKLGAPTDLQWGVERWSANDSTPYPGAMSWNFGDNHMGIYRLIVYKDGRELTRLEVSLGENADAYFSEKLGYLLAEDDIDMDSGTYHFTVQNITGFESNSSNNSDVATSPKWTYTKPSAKLEAPVSPVWNFPYCTWQAKADSSKSEWTLVRFYYSSTRSGSYELVSSMPSYKAKKEPVDTWCLKEHGPGYYKFRVTSLSDDITQWQNSAPSPLSEPYYYDGSEVKICYHYNQDMRNQKDASCTEDGYTGDYYCLDCGEVLEKGEVIPAWGHHIYPNGYCGYCGKQIEFHGAMGQSSELSWTYSLETNDITLDGPIGEGRTVYVACYKAGRFVGVKAVDSAHLSATLRSDLDKVRLIWLDGNQTPQCNAGEVTLNQ